MTRTGSSPGLFSPSPARQLSGDRARCQRHRVGGRRRAQPTVRRAPPGKDQAPDPSGDRPVLRRPRPRRPWPGPARPVVGREPGRRTASQPASSATWVSPARTDATSSILVDPCVYLISSADDPWPGTRTSTPPARSLRSRREPRTRPLGPTALPSSKYLDGPKAGPEMKLNWKPFLQ